MERIGKIILAVLILAFAQTAFAQNWTIDGVVLDKKSNKPVEFATVILGNTEQWAVADANGKFVIKNVPSGNNVIKVSCLGYVTDEKEIIISRNITGYKAYIVEDNLTLNTVVVTAKENENSASTARTIDRTTLDHVQMLNVSDISGLLPGGTTGKPDLTDKNRFSIRTGSANEAGNPSFGTAVEVDGARLSSNASFSETKGVTTNNLSTSNVESIEVISGIPSVEYGDVGSGIVKISTKKGKTPYMVTFSSNPNTKQVSASKGFGIGKKAAVLNASVEYTKAIKNTMSPYTSYDRKQISLTYSDLFNNGGLTDKPLRLTVGLSGNLGGRDSKADPDALAGTWVKDKDNSLRANMSLNWLLSKPWITGIDLNTSIVYGDKQSRERKHYSNTSSVASLHGRNEGYFVAQDYDGTDNQDIVMVPQGYSYNVMGIDDKPLTYKVGLKANWATHFGKVNNKVKLGVDWNSDKNFGTGAFTEDLATAPSFRLYDYSAQPAMNNGAVYLEDNVLIPIGKTRLNIIAGLRGEGTFINGSEYGNTYSLSPRVSAKYVVLSGKNRRNKVVRDLSFRGGYGVAVKQPSFAILYPIPSYFDIKVFNPTSTSGTAYYGYYIMPKNTLYNEDLVWQRNKQAELGMEINLAGNRISLVGYYTRTENAFEVDKSYDKFSYNYTDQAALASCGIPAANRVYSMDGKTGVVTVSDKTGVLPSEVINGKKREALTTNYYANNCGSPSNRYGLEWVIDFARIKPINTEIRLDGSFYGYKYVDYSMVEYSPTTQLMSDGTPYKYIGHYVGKSGIANGAESKRINANLTITTHIPSVRMIVSMKVEASLMRYHRYLSEGVDGAQRTYATSSSSGWLPADDPSFMDRRVLTVTYPEYYSTYDNPDELIPFKEKFLWASKNNPKLYGDLSTLCQRTVYDYYFAKDYISPYFSANFSVTKEIGDIASISFYANNFFRNLGQVYSTKTKQYSSLSSYLPAFYYGMTVRLKF